MNTIDNTQKLDIWYPPKEIAKMPGMPTTVQGVHKRAKRERWNFRRRSGIRGPAIEYNLVQRLPLGEREVFVNDARKTESLEAVSNPLEAMWSMAFRQCSDEEQKLLIRQLTQYGITSFLLKDSTHWLTLTQWFEQLPREAMVDFLKIFSKCDEFLYEESK